MRLSRNCAFCSATGHQALIRPIRNDGISLNPLPRRARRRRARPPAVAQQTDLDAVRRAVPLSTAFSELTNEIRTRGQAGEFMACCPFHEDRSPSMSISDSRGRFHCFGCGARGDLFEFERRSRGLETLPQAINSLAARFPAVAELVGRRVAPQPQSLVPAPPPQRMKIAWAQQVRDRRDVRAVLREAVRIFRSTLDEESGAVAREYLDRRGIGRRTRQVFSFGFAGPATQWTFAVDALREAGFSADDCVQAGLASVSKNDTIYDFFRGRLVVPICDEIGEVIGIAGRLIAESDRAPKYVNSKESVLFKKKAILFGAHLAREALEAAPAPDFYDTGPGICLVVVEGYMDVVALHQHSNGSFPAVATMGTAVSVEQVTAALALLPDPIDGRVIFNFDADPSGIIAAERLCDAVLSEIPEAFRVAIAFPPDGVKDADQYLSEGIGTAEDYLKHLNATALDWPKWRGRQIVQRELDRIAAKKGEEELDVSSPESIQAALNAAARRNKQKEVSRSADDVNGNLVVGGLPSELDNDSEVMFNFQLAEELSREHDRMMLSFGAPKEKLQKRYLYRKKSITVDCSPEIINELAAFLAKTQRCLLGLNSGALIQSWADALSGSESSAIPGIFAMIAERTEEINAEWSKYTAKSHVRWMPPAPWIIDELPKRERDKVLRSRGRAPEGESGTEFNPRSQQQKTSMMLLDYQSENIESPAHAKRCAASRRIREHPRRAAEERALRALIFCTEVQRLDGLNGLLAVMVRCEEKKLNFWTSASRQELFSALSEIEGDLTPEEIAAQCEHLAWWTDDIEDLFLPDDAADMEWREVRELDLKDPVTAVETSACAIEAMEKRVKGRLAVDEMDESITGALRAREEGNFEEMDKFVAKQIVLKSDINESNCLTPRQLQRQKEEEEEARRELKLKAQREKLMERLMKGEDIPAPEHILRGEVETTSRKNHEMSQDG